MHRHGKKTTHTPSWMSYNLFVIATCWASIPENMSQYLYETYLLHCKKICLKIIVSVLEVFCINGLWKFKHVYVRNLEWEYLKIILIVVKLLQHCSWNLLYNWFICQGLVHRINILMLLFVCKWYLTFRTLLCKIFMVTVLKKSVIIRWFTVNWNLLGAGWIFHNRNLHYWNWNWQTDSYFSSTSP